VPRDSRRALPAALLALMLAFAFAAGVPAVARADIGETIILRCTHGESLSGFTPSQYARALKELTADAEEYTECASLIRKAELAAAGGRGGPEATAALPASPAEQRSLAGAARAAGAVPVGGHLIVPGVVHANVASALSSLPTPLLAVLAMLIAGMAALGGNALRKRFRGRDLD
jgi:hypothetical protein